MGHPTPQEAASNERHPAMRHTDHRTLIARGRKAGLSTNDIYSALASSPPEGSERQGGRSDGNGFVTDYNQNGQVVYRPLNDENR
jgi:hypothetical protein